MFVQLVKDFLGKKAGERLSVDDAEGPSLIASGIAEAVTDSGLNDLIDKELVGIRDRLGRSMDAAVGAALQKFAGAQKLARKHAVPALFGEHGDGDPRGKSFGDWLLGVARNDRGYLEKHYGSRFNEWSQKAALGESSGAAGGYTVPPEFYQGLMQLVAENTFIRPRAFVMPMAGATLQLPYLDVTTAQSAGVSPFFAGVQMYWTAEAQTRTETEPAFKQVELKAWELSGYSVSSNVLLQDSAIGLEKFLMVLFARAIAWFEEYAFLQGNGVGKPQGMLGAGAAIATGNNGGKTGRQTANAVTFGDVAVMWSKLLPASWGSGVWACSPSVIPQLLQLQDGANRAIFLQIGSPSQGAITSAPNWALLGRPLFPTEKLPALGTRGDLMLIDPALYVIGDRMSVEIAASEHVNFLKNQMTWRVVERVDGQPWMEKAVTLQDGSTQVSPFVVLN
jgi:HK97 family phage major capsid protein